MFWSWVSLRSRFFESDQLLSSDHDFYTATTQLAATRLAGVASVVTAAVEPTRFGICFVQLAGLLLFDHDTTIDNKTTKIFLSENHDESRKLTTIGMKPIDDGERSGNFRLCVVCQPKLCSDETLNFCLLSYLRAAHDRQHQQLELTITARQRSRAPPPPPPPPGRSICIRRSSARRRRSRLNRVLCRVGRLIVSTHD